MVRLQDKQGKYKVEGLGGKSESVDGMHIVSKVNTRSTRTFRLRYEREKDTETSNNCIPYDKEINRTTSRIN